MKIAIIGGTTNWFDAENEYNNGWSEFRVDALGRSVWVCDHFSSGVVYKTEYLYNQKSVTIVFTQESKVFSGQYLMEQTENKIYVTSHYFSRDLVVGITEENTQLGTISEAEVTLKLQ